jgi:hypothetical protein
MQKLWHPEPQIQKSFIFEEKRDIKHKAKSFDVLERKCLWRVNFAEMIHPALLGFHPCEFQICFRLTGGLADGRAWRFMSVFIRVLHHPLRVFPQPQKMQLPQ